MAGFKAHRLNHQPAESLMTVPSAPHHSGSFIVGLSVRRVFVILLHLFSIHRDDCRREMKARVDGLNSLLKVDDVEQSLMVDFSADSSELLAEIERMLMLPKIVVESDRTCKRRKLKVNVNKSKVIVFEREKEHTVEL